MYKLVSTHVKIIQTRQKAWSPRYFIFGICWVFLWLNTWSTFVMVCKRLGKDMYFEWSLWHPHAFLDIFVQLLQNCFSEYQTLAKPQTSQSFGADGVCKRINMYRGPGLAGAWWRPTQCLPSSSPNEQFWDTAQLADGSTQYLFFSASHKVQFPCHIYLTQEMRPRRGLGRQMKQKSISPVSSISQTSGAALG